MFRIPRVQAALGVLAVGLLSAVAFTGPASATTTSTCVSAGKCYEVSLSAGTSVLAGDSGSFAFEVRNEATTQTLGSIEITAPAGFVVSGASTPIGTASYSPGSSSTQGSALFLHLGLSPGQSVTVTVGATVPCGSGTATAYQWTTEAKQSNQFNGSGNAFTLSKAGNLSTEVTGTCSLAFTGEPNATAVGEPITTAAASKGHPVQVGVLDGSGLPMKSSTAPVTVAIAPDSPPGSLSGTAKVDAIGGVASFSDLSISQAGQGYRLTASSPGMSPATSKYFSIYDVLPPCPGKCSGSASTKTTSANITTSSGTSGDYLAVGIGGVSFSCGSSYLETSDPASFDLLSGSGAADQSAVFAGTLEISKAAVQSSGHRGASTWQICYASTATFTAQPGTSGTATISGVTYNTGLLPDCSSTQGAPCVEARNKDNAGDVVITFLATGDPNMWG